MSSLKPLQRFVFICVCVFKCVRNHSSCYCMCWCHGENELSVCVRERLGKSKLEAWAYAVSVLLTEHTVSHITEQRRDLSALLTLAFYWVSSNLLLPTHTLTDSECYCLRQGCITFCLSRCQRATHKTTRIYTQGRKQHRVAPADQTRRPEFPQYNQIFVEENAHPCHFEMHFFPDATVMH